MEDSTFLALIRPRIAEIGKSRGMPADYLKISRSRLSRVTMTEEAGREATASGVPTGTSDLGRSGGGLVPADAVYTPNRVGSIPEHQRREQRP